MTRLRSLIVLALVGLWPAAADAQISIAKSIDFNTVVNDGFFTGDSASKSNRTSGTRGNNASAVDSKMLPVIPAIACSSPGSYTAGRPVMPCTDLFGSLFYVARSPIDGTALTPAVDAVVGSAAPTSGPQAMYQCDDSSTDAVTENHAGRARLNCTNRAQLVELVPSATAAGLDVTADQCHFITGASTNAGNCKSTAARFHGYELVNPTTTIAFLRLYNASGTPTCSSATGFIRTIPIPPAAASGQAGGITREFVNPRIFPTGLAYCVTGGGTSTDNTSAVAGVYITLDRK